MAAMDAIKVTNYQHRAVDAFGFVCGAMKDIHIRLFFHSRRILALLGPTRVRRKMRRGRSRVPK